VNDSLPYREVITDKPSISNIKMVTLYSHSRDDDALGYLRLIGPARKLGLKVIEGIEDDQIYIDRMSEGNVVVLQLRILRLSSQRLETTGHEDFIAA
jgi:hypothetical protein